MSQRLLSLVLLTGLTTFAGSAADAASFSTNMNGHAIGAQSGQTTQMAGRQPGYGYGYGNGAPPAGAPYGGPRAPRQTVFNSNDQFDTNGNLNPGGGGGGTKPSKTPAKQ